ncbi:MAG: IPT/TIG domain-containing protein [Bacteroidota bacterium]
MNTITQGLPVELQNPQPGGIKTIYLANARDVAFTTRHADGSLKYMWPRFGAAAFEMQPFPMNAGIGQLVQDRQVGTLIKAAASGIGPGVRHWLENLFGADMIAIVPRAGQQQLEVYGLNAGLQLLRANWQTGNTPTDASVLVLELGNNAAFLPDMLDAINLEPWLGESPVLTYSADTHCQSVFGTDITLTGNFLLNTQRVTLGTERLPFSVISNTEVKVTVPRGPAMSAKHFVLKTAAGTATSQGTYTRILHN